MRCQNVAPLCERGRERFARMRQRLFMADVTHLRLVYFAGAEELLVTLLATPNAWRTTPLELDDRVKSCVLRLFHAWMSIAQPDWSDGPESAGVLDWDLRANTFTHRHSGYRLQPFNIVRRG
jgi:hypothetical protein